MTPRDQFMPFATKDLALFHTTMFLSAAHLILLNPQFPAQVLFPHKVQSLHCISERLTDVKQRSTDATVCAIACFAQLEVRSYFKRKECSVTLTVAPVSYGDAPGRPHAYERARTIDPDERWNVCF